MAELTINALADFLPGSRVDAGDKPGLPGSVFPLADTNRVPGHIVHRNASGRSPGPHLGLCGPGQRNHHYQ